MSICLNAYAKLNFTLDIKGKSDDGYHILDMIMQSVSLCDELELTATDRPYEISLCGEDISDMPLDSRNTMIKAANVFFAALFPNVSFGVRINIKKRIPQSAGLAGGSSDAAAVLIGLNRLAGGIFSSDKLIELSQDVGADVAFCLVGGSARVQGKGETVMPLAPLADCFIVISKGDRKPSTGEIYHKFDRVGSLLTPDTDSMQSAVEAGNLRAVGERLCNVFEDCWNSGIIDAQKSEMLNSGALGSIMSGSGPSVFGIFDDKEKAENCRDKLSKIYPETFLTTPVESGVEILGEKNRSK